MPSAFLSDGGMAHITCERSGENLASCRISNGLEKEKQKADRGEELDLVSALPGGGIVNISHKKANGDCVIYGEDGGRKKRETKAGHGGKLALVLPSARTFPVPPKDESSETGFDSGSRVGRFDFLLEEIRKKGEGLQSGLSCDLSKDIDREEDGQKLLETWRSVANGEEICKQLNLKTESFSDLEESTRKLSEAIEIMENEVAKLTNEVTNIKNRSIPIKIWQQICKAWDFTKQHPWKAAGIAARVAAIATAVGVLTGGFAYIVCGIKISTMIAFLGTGAAWVKNLILGIGSRGILKGLWNFGTWFLGGTIFSQTLLNVRAAPKEMELKVWQNKIATLQAKRASLQNLFSLRQSAMSEQLQIYHVLMNVTMNLLSVIYETAKAAAASIGGR
jgi:ElaB/YqjD/DUF883 family membrane-anchored ribosome-binding protein